MFSAVAAADGTVSIVMAPSGTVAELLPLIVALDLRVILQLQSLSAVAVIYFTKSA
jgi:hypothetical protein